MDVQGPRSRLRVFDENHLHVVAGIGVATARHGHAVPQRVPDERVPRGDVTSRSRLLTTGLSAPIVPGRSVHTSDTLSGSAPIYNRDRVGHDVTRVDSVGMPNIKEVHTAPSGIAEKDVRQVNEAPPHRVGRVR